MLTSIQLHGVRNEKLLNCFYITSMAKSSLILIYAIVLKEYNIVLLVFIMLK